MKKLRPNFVALSNAMKYPPTLIVVASVAAISYTIAVTLDLYELFTEWTRPWEFLEVDEIPVVIFFVAIALAAVAYGKHHRLAKEVEERRRLEAQLAHAQRMESIGQLAGGIAHDFNNLLTVIQNYTHLGIAKVAEGDPLREDLEEIGKAGDRAATLASQLLGFSRHQPIVPRPTDFNEAILSSLKMLRRLITENIELALVPSADLELVEIDPARLEQVLVNLTVNARDAMPHGGKLTFETSNVDLGPEDTEGRLGLKPGRHVVLKVRDTGTGIDEDAKNRIFEPFFTTKEMGQGTGLGLFTSYGIVNQCGGYIEVESRVGEGTTFSVYFPVVVKTPSEEPVTQAVDPEINYRGSSMQETILVVEDEPAVRTVTARMLRASGYSVLEAENGSEALNLVKENPKCDIDLVVTDMVMPLMGGTEFIDRLKMTHPDIPVLFYSGYTDYPAIGQPDESPPMFLQKPFTPAELNESVKEALKCSGAAL